MTIKEECDKIVEKYNSVIYKVDGIDLEKVDHLIKYFNCCSIQCAILEVEAIQIVLENELMELYKIARSCDINLALQVHYKELLTELKSRI
jgi:hypothetical protein